MKTTILLVFLLTLSANAFGKEPLFAFVEYDPWSIVIGSDSPSFVIYSDRTVIFLQSYENDRNRKKGKGFKFYSTKLNDSLFTVFERSFLNRVEIEKFKNHYDLVQGYDYPTDVFNWFFEDKYIYTSIYGGYPYLYQDGLKGFEYLKNIAKVIKSFRPVIKEEWHPKEVEVMFWPYEYAPQKSIKWPDNWPDLNSTKSIKRSDASINNNTTDNNKESYSVFIPYSEYNELIIFLKKKKKKGAVEINGKKMAVALRYPFQGEQKWIKNNQHCN